MGAGTQPSPRCQPPDPDLDKGIRDKSAFAGPSLKIIGRIIAQDDATGRGRAPIVMRTWGLAMACIVSINARKNFGYFTSPSTNAQTVQRIKNPSSGVL
ncbi:MAG: hypothetical protein EOO38_21115 [Cytophagaceae bacterium]|nr:MAG: hypothetical protein EOO38_21115 [Cytophagaceae bacterium]